MKPGVYLVQWRKRDFAVAQYGITMEAKEQLRFNVKLGPAEREFRTNADLAAVVAQEATRRIGMKGVKAVIVSRAELERFGSIRLDAALRESSAAMAMREVRQACALIDGHESLDAGGKAEIMPVFRRDRGPTSIHAEGVAVRDRASAPSGPPRPLPPPGSWVSHFQADEVEMIEVYPEGSENSRTMCGRFRPSSGCSCPPDPSGLVIWLRK
jgi:Arc/MetJ family transcription regulator